MRSTIEIAKPVILCIENNEGHLRLRQAVLEQNGYSVLGATTDIEALNILRGAPIALVISDHMLGTITGTHLAKQIREIRPLVPILLYTGTMPDDLTAASSFLNKGEPVETFLSVVASLIGG
jgi:CheY-like chemotaxis protein